MTVSMVARAFYVLVVALLFGTVIAYRLRARRRRADGLRASIREGAAQARRERRRKARAFVRDFQSGEGSSSVPWPDAGAPNCSGPARRLLTDTLVVCTPDLSAPQAIEDDAVTTPYQSLPPSPSTPQPVALRVTAAQAWALIVMEEAPGPSETLAASWPAVRATAAAALLLVLFGVTGRATITRKAPPPPQKVQGALVEVAHA